MNSRTVRNVLVISALALVSVLGPGSSAGARTSAAPQMPRFLWGAWIGNQFTGEQPPWDWKAVNDFEARNTGGRRLNALHWGVRTPWDYDFNYWRGALDIARKAGVISVVDMATDNVPLRAIANGARDGALKTWASEAASWGQPLLLRFDFEMNGRWFPWGTTQWNQNTPADFVAAWRHVHQIFTNAGATNVLWVWCPNIALHHRNSLLAKDYPGNNYVDWTCLDGYNFGHPWTSFARIYSFSYKKLVHIAPSKPMLIGEIGSTEHGGSKAGWIRNMFGALATRFRHIHGLLWYDVPGDQDWPIETSKSSSAAFSSGIGSTLTRVCHGLGGGAKAQCMGRAATSFSRVSARRP
jgi:Glycosyl hydrolase family 26